MYCDDINNDKLDEGEDFVEFSTKYDYDKAEEGTRKVLSLKPRISVQTENLDRELEQIMVFELAKVITKVL